MKFNKLVRTLREGQKFVRGAQGLFDAGSAFLEGVTVVAAAVEEVAPRVIERVRERAKGAPKADEKPAPKRVRVEVVSGPEPKRPKAR